MAHEKQPPHAVIAAAQEEAHDKTRERVEREENIILTAWHSMSGSLQRSSLCGGPAAPGSTQAQSFLARQRQSTQARRSCRLQPLQPAPT